MKKRVLSLLAILLALSLGLPAQQPARAGQVVGDSLGSRQRPEPAVPGAARLGQGRHYLPVVLNDAYVGGPGSTYSYLPGSMHAAPNCGVVYMQGIVYDRQGRLQNGVTVELQFWDNAIYRVTGEGNGAGKWSFAPLNGTQGPVPFTVQLVLSEETPIPISSSLPIPYLDCRQAGQFTGITFIQD